MDHGLPDTHDCGRGREVLWLRADDDVEPVGARRGSGERLRPGRVDNLVPALLLAGQGLELAHGERLGETENVRPVLVMLDELESALQEISEKEDPEDSEAVATSRQLVGRFLREARYVGIHVVLATQRWTVEALGKESSGWRANAGLRWVLGRMNLDTLKVSTVETDSCRVAYERAWGAGLEDEELDAPESVHGLGIAELDYRDPAAVRACWPGTGEEQAALLREHDVAEPGGPAPQLGGGPPPDWGTVTEPVETKPVEMEMSLDDLDADQARENRPAAGEPNWDELLGR